MDYSSHSSPSQTPRGNPHTLSPICYESFSAESTDGRLPHTTGPNGRSPHTTSTDSRGPHTTAVFPSANEDAYAEFCPRQQQQELLQEMRTSIQTPYDTNTLVPAPAYTPCPYSYPYPANDGTTNLHIASLSYQQPYVRPPSTLQPYPVPSTTLLQSSTTLTNPITAITPSLHHPEQFQAVNYGPNITGSSPTTNNGKPAVDTVYASTTSTNAIAYVKSPGQKRRRAFWGCCICVVLIAIILGVVLGVVVKNKDQSETDNSTFTFGPKTASTAKPSLSSSTSSSSGATATPTTTSSSASISISTATQPPPSPTPDAATCMRNCSTKFSKCLDGCTAEENACENKCGDNFSCKVDCGFARSKCTNPCFSASRLCTC
ncbi:hypothetical protein BC939DRAFT_510915 [Gamsiella multidivaricata]|uniref:uncharacterized protein n=1 Tax=Gamsiella multidivaricata TaxID=101098 RepID=UPI00221F8DC0|nr:uncharacterized protein BC939DRAFT_510915 [Gamsiella multidivaricata]KAI7816520.1 hypothetical protein BC939DRAFT_510915 [Gamsiella multidivaricata]